MSGNGGPRYAIYWAPHPEHPLWRAGTAWTGRDPTGAVVDAAPDLPGLPEIVADAGRYGFHATLKPPMRLHPDTSVGALATALAEVAAGIAPFAMPKLRVESVDGFLCLRETRESAALQALADAMIAGLDHFRAAPSARELEMRRAAGLTTAQEINLRRWGYPYVFATWFFHMTLTRRLSGAEAAWLRPAAETWFAEALADPVEATDVCLFEQPAPGAPFLLRLRAGLAG